MQKCVCNLRGTRNDVIELGRGFEALEVLKHLLTEEEQLSLSKRGIIPVLQEPAVMKAFGSESKYGEKNFQAILSSKFAPMAARPVYAGASFNHYSAPLKALAAGETDLNTAFRQIDEAIAKMISEEKAKLSAASK